MATFAQQFPPPTNGVNGPRTNNNRQSGEFRNGSTSVGANGMPVPGQGRMGNGPPPGIRNMGFDGPRSPPAPSKNTAHVPCKFFRQGACQAGKACPFLHTNEPSAESAPCKYFAKGNCKFGAKCALAHILPNGQRVNKPSLLVGGALNLGGRMYQEPPGGGSLLTMQAAMVSPGMPGYAYPQEDPWQAQQNVSAFDTNLTSHPGSTYGSPPNDGRIPMSPVQKGLSVLDAPLPASFDSQGISHNARYGPIAASVPSRFGFESPPSSLPNKSHLNNATLRNLHDSAFGDDSRQPRLNDLGSSPPNAADEIFNRRLLHSERFASRTKMYSSSVGANRPSALAVDDWETDDDNFVFEEDLVPANLHDLLTPQEKMRRFSRTEEDNNSNPMLRRPMSGIATPTDPKVGSPGMGSSPSRFSTLFARQHAKSSENGEVNLSNGTSAFGHVGSPLRNSTLHPGASPSLRGLSRATSSDTPFGVNSPPRQSSMSMISQQLQRTKLAERTVSSDSNISSLSRALSSSSIAGVNGAGKLDRAVSSSSIGRSERIEEEQGLFSMEEEDEEGHKDGKKLGSGESMWGQAAPMNGINGESSQVAGLGAIGSQRKRSES